jgi:2Fe-2S ferredoxin
MPAPRRALASGERGGSSGPPSPPQDPDEAEAFELVTSAGHRPAVAKGVLAALRESRLSGAAMLSAVRGLLGRPEVGEDGGLEPLVAAVEQQLAREEGRATVRFTVLTPQAPEGWSDAGSQQFEVEAFEGMSITDVVKMGSGPGATVLAELLECACSGVMACSTCQVIVAPEWFERVGAPDEAEEDMLDLAFEPQETSRLGCQIILRPELDGLRVRVPRDANNMMDSIPFPG